MRRQLHFRYRTVQAASGRIVIEQTEITVDFNDGAGKTVQDAVRQHLMGYRMREHVKASFV